MMFEDVDIHALPGLDVIPPRHTLRYIAPYDAPFFDALRRKGDPLADDVVRDLLATGRHLDMKCDLLGETRRRAESTGGVCRRFLDACHEPPTWVDFRAMGTGQDMIAAFPLHMGLSLFSGSLVGGAVFHKMSLVTLMTGMVGGETNRRLNETVALVLRMALPGSLVPGGEAHELLVRVRLLHAALRHVLVASGRFSHPHEVPINQHDLAITLGLFGYVNIRSLERMGIRFRESELAAYNLVWRYAGHVLGIQPELLPRSVREQQAFFLASLKHQGRPEKLDPSIKGVMDNVARSATRRAPSFYAPVQRCLYQVCRYLTGNEYVSGMELEDLGDDFWGLRVLRGLGRFKHTLWHYAPGGRELLGAAGRVQYRRRLAQMRRGRARTYRVRMAGEPG